MFLSDFKVNRSWLGIPPSKLKTGKVRRAGARKDRHVESHSFLSLRLCLSFRCRLRLGLIGSRGRSITALLLRLLRVKEGACLAFSARPLLPMNADWRVPIIAFFTFSAWAFKVVEAGGPVFISSRRSPSLGGSSLSRALRPSTFSSSFSASFLG